MATQKKKPVSGKTASRSRTGYPSKKKQKSKSAGLWRAAIVLSLVGLGVLAVAVTGLRDNASKYLKNIHSSFAQNESDLGLDSGITQQDVPALLDSASQTAAQLAEEGTIGDYEVSDDVVYMETTDGVGMVYAPVVAAEPEQSVTLQTPSAAPPSEAPSQETDAPTENSPSPQPAANTSPNVLSLQPSYDMFLSTFSSADLESIDSAAARYAEAWSSLVYDPATCDLDNAQVTPETILSFPDYKVIIWEGHGGYSERTHSFLFTGQKYTDAYYAQHEEDFLNGNLVATTDGYVAVTAGYFDRYLPAGSLDGAVIYLAACSSCKDDTLVRTLLNKGAEAVYAVDGIVYTSYNYAMLDWISIDLCGYNGRVMNTGDALSDAQSTYGYMDNYLLTPAAGIETNGSTVQLFGNRSYTFS